MRPENSLNFRFSKTLRNGRSKRSVLKLKTKPKNKREDEIGRFTPSDWSNREKEAQETGWARFSFRFCLIVFAFNQKPKSKKLKTNRASRPNREPRPWRPPQLRMPRRLDGQTTESRKHTNHMPLMPVNAASITSVEPVAHGAVPRRIDYCAVHSKIVCCSK